ncbi:MAG: hypothetical protein A3G18_01495 [Rhodospirillales bacterium RIFCSPLOWO2_12_FULL_58_28]|nr:MAG: hypothetical protein A3H92_08030 [Rhodospirillales bacterium RIFCSPLOWO2_02_FULL_58_16]OHC78970.1 MAG: hypothetical protein A3G18_01495 [Rhodospirillales bacterium RIFCSPLOWO2_12_FULL_58_28]
MAAPDPRQQSYGEERPPTFVDKFGHWLSARRIRLTIKRYPGARIGDIGCGYHAGVSRLFLNDAESLTITDISISPELKAHPKITAIEGRLPKALAGIADASLDVVISNSVIEHLWNPVDTLKEIRRITAPGGICLINAPSWKGKFYLEFAAYRLGLSPVEEMDDHKTYYDPDDLLPLLIEAGFDPAHIRCFRHKFGLNTFAECAAPSTNAEPWDNHWRRYADSAKANPAQAFRRRLIFRILEDVGIETQAHVLDIGCGSGDLLAELRRRYPTTTMAGVDISRDGLEETQRKLPGVTLVHSDLTGPQPEPGELAGWATHAVCSEVLEHVDDPTRLLTNAAAMMEPGCALVVTVPDGPVSAFDRHLGHRRHFTKAELKQVLEDAGFNVIGVAAAGFPVFNLYRLAVLLRGKRLIADADGKPGLTARVVMALFNRLLPLSLPDAPWGWQIIALAIKKD